MKTKLLLLFVLFSIAISQAQTFSDGTLEYTVTTGTNVSVKRLGIISITNTIIIPETITDSGITYTVTSIAEEGFKDYGSLQNVTIPNTVQSIGAGAFQGCSDIYFTDIVIPEGVIVIEPFTFEGCHYLQNITIPSTVTTIGEKAFSECQRVVTYNLPAGLTSIGSYAFANSQDITEISIPSGVTTISEGAFDKCEALEDIILPSTITSIEAYAFRDCQGITELTIPSSVTSIGDDAFAHLWDLKTVNVSWTTPFVLSSNVFSMWTGATTLNVPMGTVEDYEDAYVWKDFDPISEDATLSTPNLNISKAVEIYPNPVQNVLSIQLNEGLELKEIKIYNSLGQLVKQNTISRFNMGTLKPGLYILQINTNQGSITKNILKK